MPKYHSSLSLQTATGAICRICLKDRPREDFEPDLRMRSGIRTECRDCHRARKLAAYHRRKAEIAAIRKERYQADPIKHRESALASYHRHRARALRQKRRYREANPHLGRIWNHLRRVRLKAAGGRFTAADIVRIYNRQRGCCYWCSLRLIDGFEVDHVIPISRGGGNYPENIVIACEWCNGSKYDKLPVEWLYAHRKYSHRRSFT